MNFQNFDYLTNIDNYPGLLPYQIVPPYIYNIKQIFYNLPENTVARNAIDTYIRLLEYYNQISNKNSPLLQPALTFCEELNRHLENHIAENYPQYNISLELKGRIKSPVSAINKFRATIGEYLKKEKDLDTLRINDLFAIRFIIEVRDKNNMLLDDNIAIPICYDVVQEILEYCRNSENIVVLKSEPRSNKRIEIVHDIILPKSVPEYIKQNEDYIKDYINYPKAISNYQSAHIKLAYINQTSDTPLLFEIQTRTALMNDHAEHGPAEHRTYKSRNIVSFSRVPQLLHINENGFLVFKDMNDAFKEFYNFSLSLIKPQLSFEYLQSFLEKTNFQIPIALLGISIDEDGNVELNDTGKLKVFPLEIPRNQISSNISIDQSAINLFTLPSKNVDTNCDGR